MIEHVTQAWKERRKVNEVKGEGRMKGRDGYAVCGCPQGVEREGAMDLDGCNGMEAYI